MSQSILITGSTKKEREKFAKETAAKVSSHFDTFILDTEIEKSIEKVREIVRNLVKKPFNSSLSSLLILEADNLNNESQNSLLKTLEEPNEKSQIILTSQNKNNLLPTVVSRCLEISLNNNKTETKDLEFSSFSAKLDYFEKTTIEELTLFYQKKLKENLTGEPAKLKKLHRVEKMLLKMKKASKANVNKKLIALILALETP